MDSYLNSISRAEMLMAQDRWDLAEESIRKAISEDPDRGLAYSVLAIIRTQKEDYATAQEVAERGIALSPDDSYSHYALACVFSARHKYKPALIAIDVAISMDPTDADYHARRSFILISQYDWEGAIKSAETGLQFDPEHVLCNNARSIALTKVGRRGEASATIESVLAKSPEDATTHANYGWNMLHQGKPKEAAEHFKEALRLEPSNEWAREGIIESLKASNFFYRQVLRYMLWVSRFPPRTQMIAFVGIIIVLQVMVRMPDGTLLANIGVGLAFVYMAFVSSIWLASPLFDLLLRFNRFGRYVLTDDRRTDTNYTALALVAVAFFISGPLITGFRRLDIIGYTILLIPVAVMLNTPRKAKRKLAAGIVVGIFAVAALYWYRWYIDTGIDGMRSLSDLVAFLDSATEEEMENRKIELRELVRSQNQLSDFFLWPSILMSWFSEYLRRVDR